MAQDWVGLVRLLQGFHFAFCEVDARFLCSTVKRRGLCRLQHPANCWRASFYLESL